MLNLDYICAKISQNLVEIEKDKNENTLRKALGVLQNDV